LHYPARLTTKVVAACANFGLREQVPRWEKDVCIMYQISIYPITPNLWRWEIRCGGALLRCGTATTRAAAEIDVNEVVNS
jgi:hypothetical protein